ncbi:hypothetical protein ACFOX0_13260 [Micromonospora zhanjiangensis]|uniref:Integral membrane protein n=1 Tax=Micromonospora zhanjiangensis TaxID=1522057 RepID=A0ABV8KLK0_9ACTN
MAGRLIELRVHGVSNTPPADILGMPPAPDGSSEPMARPWLVAGDATTGFYRSPADNPNDPVAVEAYSWGQLTSGARAAKDVERALWTLLLPFTLANVALHASPEIPADPRQERWASRPGITAWLVRLFCLSLTVTFVLAAAGLGVDLIGWQCVDRACLKQIPGPWEFLGTGWWSESTHPLAVGLLLPLTLLAVVGLLTWRTYQYEAEMPAAPADPADRPLDNPLQDPTFWCGEGQVRRLAALHLATGAAVAAAVPLGAVIISEPLVGARAAVGWPAAAALGASVVLAAAALGHPYATRRSGDTPVGRYGTVIVCLALLGVVGTFLVLLLPDVPAGSRLAGLRPPPGCATDATIAGCGQDRSLPGYEALIAWLSSFQVLLLIAVAGVARTGRWALCPPIMAALALPLGHLWATDRLPGTTPPPSYLRTWMVTGVVVALAAAVTLLLPRHPTRPPERPPDRRTAMAWGGRGPAVLAGLGWLLTVSYSVGVLYWAANRLNHGTAPGGLPPVTLPVPVLWAGPAFVVALLVAAGVAGRAWLLFAGLRRRCLAELFHQAGELSAHERRRARDVASFRALHRLVGGHALRLVGRLTTAAVGLAAAGTVAALAGLRPQPRSPDAWAMAVKAAVDVGASLAGLLPVLIAGVGLLVYRNDSVRRAVGVIWDVGTFWPRSAHPLAPPSYAERAVPQLQTRTTGLLALPEQDPRRAEAIVLSGHSQGAVISAAVILQLPSRWRRRVWFFSYGCQLTRLYGRVFPAYFGPDRLPAVAATLTGPSDQPRWTNFWRETDPLGWPVGAGERQIPVRDPEALHPRDGEVRDPPIRSHGGYPESPEYQLERSAVVAAMLTGAVPVPRRPSTPTPDPTEPTPTPP